MWLPSLSLFFIDSLFVVKTIAENIHALMCCYGDAYLEVFTPNLFTLENILR